MITLPKRSKRAAMMLTALVAAAAAVAVTAGTASSHHAERQAHRAISGRLAQVFQVLDRRVRARRAAAAGGRPLPTGVVAGMSRQPGVDPSQAAYAGGEYPTWVVPGSSEVCLVVGATGTRGVPSSVCGPISRAESGLVVLTETDSGQPLVLGLAPDGNRSVSVTDKDDATESVPVTDNVFEIVRGHPVSVSLKDTAGNRSSRSVAISAPPGPTRPTE